MVNFIPLGARNRWSQILFAGGLGVLSGYYLWKEPLEQYFAKERRDASSGSDLREGKPSR